MKVLIDCNIVKYRKVGTWIYYSLNEEVVREAIKFLNGILNHNKD